MLTGLCVAELRILSRERKPFKEGLAPLCLEHRIPAIVLAQRKRSGCPPAADPAEAAVLAVRHRHPESYA